jgi:hypothetical protein
MTNKKKKGETKEENKRHVGKNTNNPKKIWKEKTLSWRK